MRALAKLEHVLPTRLRHRITTLAQAVVQVPGTGPTVAAEVLTAVAAAARDHVRLRFDYADRHGTTSRRDTEPHRLVHTGRRWYLVAWDVDRGDWRTFRADRITPRIPTGPRFAPREPPDPDLAGYVTRGAGGRCGSTRPASACTRPRRRSHTASHRRWARSSRSTTTTASSARAADTLRVLALYLGLLDVDFDVLAGLEARLAWTTEEPRPER